MCLFSPPSPPLLTLSVHCSVHPISFTKQNTKCCRNYIGWATFVVGEGWEEVLLFRVEALFQGRYSVNIHQHIKYPQSSKKVGALMRFLCDCNNVLGPGQISRKTQELEAVDSLHHQLINEDRFMSTFSLREVNNQIPLRERLLFYHSSFRLSIILLYSNSLLPIIYPLSIGIGG